MRIQKVVIIPTGTEVDNPGRGLFNGYLRLVDGNQNFDAAGAVNVPVINGVTQDTFRTGIMAEDGIQGIGFGIPQLEFMGGYGVVSAGTLTLSNASDLWNFLVNNDINLLRKSVYTYEVYIDEEGLATFSQWHYAKVDSISHNESVVTLALLDAYKDIHTTAPRGTVSAGEFPDASKDELGATIPIAMGYGMAKLLKAGTHLEKQTVYKSGSDHAKFAVVIGFKYWKNDNPAWAGGDLLANAPNYSVMLDMGSDITEDDMNSWVGKYAVLVNGNATNTYDGSKVVMERQAIRVVAVSFDEGWIALETWFTAPGIDGMAIALTPRSKVINQYRNRSAIFEGVTSNDVCVLEIVDFSEARVVSERSIDGLVPVSNSDGFRLLTYDGDAKSFSPIRYGIYSESFQPLRSTLKLLPRDPNGGLENSSKITINSFVRPTSVVFHGFNFNRVTPAGGTPIDLTPGNNGGAAGTGGVDTENNTFPAKNAEMPNLYNYQAASSGYSIDVVRTRYTGTDSSDWYSIVGINFSVLMPQAIRDAVAAGAKVFLCVNFSGGHGTHEVSDSPWNIQYKPVNHFGDVDGMAGPTMNPNGYPVPATPNLPYFRASDASVFATIPPEYFSGQPSIGPVKARIPFFDGRFQTLETVANVSELIGNEFVSERIKIRLDMGLQGGYTSLGARVTLKVSQVAFVVSNEVEDIPDDIYTNYIGEPYGPSWAGRSYSGGRTPVVATNPVIGPVDAIEHLMRSRDDAADFIDTVAFDAAVKARRPVFSGGSQPWQVGRHLDDPKSTVEWIDELAQNCLLAFVPKHDGTRAPKAWFPPPLPSEVPLLDDSRWVTGTLTDQEDTGMDRVYSEFELNYGKNPATGEYDKQISVNLTDVESEFPSEDAGENVLQAIAFTSYQYSIHEKDPVIRIELPSLPPGVTEIKLTGGHNEATGLNNWNWLSPRTIRATAIEGPRIYVWVDWIEGEDGGAISTSGTFYSAGTLYGQFLASNDWKKFVTGYSDYATAKAIWEKCRAGYLVTGNKNRLTLDLPWFPDLSTWTEAETGVRPATIPTAGLLLGLIADWLTKPKKKASGLLPINPDNMALELADCFVFRNDLLTSDKRYYAWITSLSIVTVNEGGKMVERLRAEFLWWPWIQLDRSIGLLNEEGKGLETQDGALLLKVG